ncbi:hypothetical protein DRQ33_04120 [bacterium]|nr:MAG: hypothetical protein DRQ33_04120 [bacterium]
MSKVIHILIIEDEIADARLLVEEIQSAEYEVVYEVVNSLDTIEEALERKKWDIILCDYNMPGFNAVKVLEIIAGKDIATPVIVVSGFIGEEKSLELMRTGARDFILKDNLSRLIPAIEREIEEMDIRRDRKHKEILLEQQNKLIDTILGTSADLISIKSRDFTYQTVNSAFCEFLGMDRNKIIGKSDFDIFSPSKAEKYQKLDAKVLITDEVEIFEDEIKKGENVRYFHIAKNPIYNANGATVGILTSMRDITEFKLAVEALRENEERYRRLVEVSPDGIIVHNDKEILFINQAGLKILGFDNDELIREKSLTDFVHPDSLDIAQKRLEQILEFGEPAGLIEEKYITTDGDIRFVETASVPISWQNSRAVQTVIRDVSKQKQAERALLKSQKLEALGMLAGGIGHDFNNFLTAILLKISLALKSLHNTENVKELLNQCEHIIQKAKGLTQQLLTFAEGGAPIIKPCSIEEIIKQTAEFTLSGSNVTCTYSIDENLLSARADENQISQVIYNLMINAQQAMPYGGNIDINAENVILSENNQFALKPGKYVKITLSDSGNGIPKEHLNKIFDPYFTTKERGSGLGLAVVYSIIKKHRGYIGVESEQGNGTTFTIYIPATEKKPLPVEIEPISTQISEGKILIMDDEPEIRESLAELLSDFGYSIDTASEGGEALEKYRIAKQQNKPFDIVILDLTIQGGMGGKETIDKLRRFDPQVKAIVSSGYSNDPIMANYKDYGFCGIITKPYRVDKLISVINKVLNN